MSNLSAISWRGDNVITPTLNTPDSHYSNTYYSGGVPLYIDLIQYGDDVMIFEILLGFSWTQNYLK
jgi:hypothetical protein